MNDQKNTLLAIVLSALVLIVWQIFVGLPQMDKQQQQQQQTQQQQQQAPGRAGRRTRPRRPARPHRPARRQTPAGAPQVARPARRGPDADPRADPRPVAPRRDRDAAARRLDLAQGRAHRRRALTSYRETVDPNIAADRAAVAGRQRASLLRRVRLVAAPAAPRQAARPRHAVDGRRRRTLGADQPVTLTWDNGEGLDFRRTHRGRRQLHVHRQATRSRTRATSRSRSIPTA